MKASTRRISSLITVVVGLLVLPATASAVVYCVPNDTIDPSCDTGQGQATIQAALSAAQSSGTVADTVRIGAGNYSEANLTYSSGVGTNVLTLIGAGASQTKLTIPDTTGSTIGLFVGAPAGSSLTGLAMTIPANADVAGDIGIDYGSGVAGQNLLVDGPAASNARGLQLTGSASLDDSTVNLPFASEGNIAVSGANNSTVTDANLHANTGVRFGSVDRSTITASTTGASLDSGTLNVRNTLINLGTNNNAVGVQVANLNNGTTALTGNVDGVTIVGGGTNSAGVQVQADSAVSPPNDPNDTTNDGETGTANVSNTVISGPAHSLVVQADRGEIANMTTTYSNYNSATKVVTNDLSGGGATGTANFSESNQTNNAPGFVDPAASNFHLLPTSALLDIGDPGSPSGTDIDGDPRALSKNPQPCSADSVGTRDIGADEYSCVPPETTITSGPSGLISDAIFTFGFSSEAGATFECRFDSDPFAACSGPGATETPPTLLPDGPHQFEVRAIDVNANPDPTPATRAFTLDTTAPDTTVTGKPKVRTRKKKAPVIWTFGSTEPGSTFECSLDGGPFAPCTSPFTAKLRRGAHTLAVRATDAAGNQDGSPASFTTRVKRKK